MTFNSSIKDHSPDSCSNSEVVNQTKQNLLVEAFPESIRKGLIAPTPAGVDVLHLDNSLNSKVSGVLVLAERKKTWSWRSLRQLSPEE